MLPRKIGYVQVVPGAGNNKRLGLYEKGGGLYSRITAARHHARNLEAKGFKVKLYEAEVSWTEVPLADDAVIEEGPLP